MAIWKTHPFLCIGHTHSLLSAIAVFICFINIQKDADERKLTQAGRTNIAIYAPNLRFVYVDTNNSVRSWRMGMLTIKFR